MTTPTPPPPLSEEELADVREVAERILALRTRRYRPYPDHDMSGAVDDLLRALPPETVLSLLASARRCAELEAFLAEHGDATQRALKVAYFGQGATSEQQAEWDEAHRELRELRWIR